MGASKAKMPKSYQAEIPVWDAKRNIQVKTVMNFLLPFEVLENMITLENLREFSDFAPHQYGMGLVRG